MWLVLSLSLVNPNNEAANTHTHSYTLGKHFLSVRSSEADSLSESDIRTQTGDQSLLAFASSGMAVFYNIGCFVVVCLSPGCGLRSVTILTELLLAKDDLQPSFTIEALSTF